MKKLTLILRISFLLMIVTALVTYPVISNYAGKAQLVQLVQPSEGADLFGDIGEFVGTPQMLVNEIPAEAILEGAGPNGSILVDSSYLEAHEISTQQLQTVVFIAESLRTATLIGAGVFLVALLAIRWRIKALSPNEYPAGVS